MSAIQDSITQLGERAAAMLDAVDVQKRAERLAAELSERGYGPDGPFRHAPPNVLADQRKAIHQELDAIAAERLREIEAAVRESLEDLPTIEAHARLAPTAVQAFKALHKNEPYTAGDLVQVQVLEELRLARYEREIGRMGPSAVLDLYSSSAVQGGEEADAIVRFVEDRLPKNWAGVATSPDDAVAVQQLARTIRETRERRIPEDIRQWRAAVDKARKAITLARDVHRVQPAPSKRAPSDKATAEVDGQHATLHPARRRAS
jgi:hypothetical protein